MSDAAITALQYIAVAALTLAGQWLIAKLSKSAQDDQTEVTSQEKATEAWQAYAEKMEARMEILEARQGEDRQRIRNLERRAEHDRSLIRKLASRLRSAVAQIRDLGAEPDFAAVEALERAETRLELDDYS